MNHTTTDNNDILREFDRESATRIWSGRPKLAVTLLTVCFSLYCIWSTLFSVAALEVRLTSFLGMMILIGYLNYPADRHHVRENSLPWYDVLLMCLGAAGFFWFCFSYRSLMQAKILSSAAKLTPWMIVPALCGAAALFELCRRAVGVPILCVVGALLVYTFCSRISAGQTVWQTLQGVTYTLFYSTGGILGTPVQVCAKFIAVFIIFGAFLERTGIAAFFIQLANALVGSASGGPAKVAVISSALCGMVSGSSVGNTVTTGSVTIPMMKKAGYRPEFAGAVEAAASTGGQIMPPIMGAAAFLMAEYIGIPYSRVALYAILPAVLYFTGIFIAVHLEAKKLGLRGIPKEELPKFSGLWKGLYLLLPLVVLIWLVSTGTRTLAYSAAIAILISVAVTVPGFILETGASVKAASGSKEKTAAGTAVLTGNVCRKTGKLCLDSLEAGGKSCITVVSACSMAGIVAGCITATGLASRLISSIVTLSHSISSPAAALLAALVLTMLCCIVLGMGVPTTANYCIMASTCAPILITLGIDKIAAHFFVFYFGIVADITPPVALAAFAGAAIAEANPIRTGLNATRLAIGAFIVPFVFAMDPSLLLFNEGLASGILTVATAVIGIFDMAAALNGFIFRPMTVPERILLILGGIMLLIPGILTDVLGLALTAAVILLQKFLRK